MLYVVVGTDVEIRKKGLLKILHGRNPSLYLRKETMFQVPALIDAQDIFGGEVIVMLEQVGNDAEGRELLKGLLKAMQTSKNIFILDEPFIDTSFVKTVAKYAELIIEAKEEKVKEGFPTAFLSSFEKKDKKQAWVEWMNLRDKEVELIHGALWWKVKTLWSGVLQGKKSAFSKEELAALGFALVTGSHKAHRGEADLREEIEKVVLGL